MLYTDEENGISKRRVILLYIFSILLGLVCATIIYRSENKQHSFEVITSFYIITFFCFINLINAVKEHSFSLNIMFWLFNLFFYGIAPLLQYTTNSYSWNMHPSDNEIITANRLIIIWIISYLIGRRVCNDISEENVNTNKTITIDDFKLSILLVGSILITLYNLVFIGFNNLLFRSTNQNTELSKMGSLITVHGFHNFVLFTLVLFILKERFDQKIDIRFYIILICFIVSCFPTGMARNMMASFYLGLFIVIFNKYKDSRWISVLLIMGLVLVFPAINVFRTTSAFENGNITEKMLLNIQSTYVTGDYDAHQLFICIRKWGNNFGLSYGKQLLGALLFFIPRSIWSSKPYGTGQTAFEQTNQYWYTNVSAPLISEAWINFGVIGIIIFGLLIGFIINKIDNIY